MPARCKLCHRPITDTTNQIHCECGWIMDKTCNDGHHDWCPKHGTEGWIGAVER